jgi:hypothetical protein
MSLKHLGKFYESSEGVRFETSVRLNEKWRLRYNELKSMKKVRYTYVLKL